MTGHRHPVPSEQRVCGDHRGGDRRGEPRVEADVCYESGYFVCGESVVDSAPQVRRQFVGSVKRDQRTQGGDTSVAGT